MASERINITISDDLHKRLQTVKDRLTVSAICQEALEQAVAIEEYKMNASASRDEVVSRLRLQRQQVEDEWYQEGKKAGLEAAPECSYDEFATLEEHDKFGRSGMDIVDSDPFTWVVDKAQDDYECPEHLLFNFYEGFFAGLREYWDTIRSEVLEN